MSKQSFSALKKKFNKTNNNDKNSHSNHQAFIFLIQHLKFFKQNKVFDLSLRVLKTSGINIKKLTFPRSGFEHGLIELVFSKVRFCASRF